MGHVLKFLFTSHCTGHETVHLADIVNQALFNSLLKILFLLQMIEIQCISKKVNFLAHITKKSIGTGMDEFNGSNDVVRVLLDSMS